LSAATLLLLVSYVVAGGVGGLPAARAEPGGDGRTAQPRMVVVVRDDDDGTKGSRKAGRTATGQGEQAESAPVDDRSWLVLVAGGVEPAAVVDDPGAPGHHTRVWLMNLPPPRG
jgi:hypothetical protein